MMSINYILVWGLDWLLVVKIVLKVTRRIIVRSFEAEGTLGVLRSVWFSTHVGSRTLARIVRGRVLQKTVVKAVLSF